VGVQVPERKEHGKWLLHAEEAVEGPFAVELDYGLAGGDSLRGDDVLAGVVTFGRAVPEEETTEGRFSIYMLASASVLGGA
jgi:hypothetical protein